MKVLIFNGSPRQEKGHTHLLLSPFIEGLKKTGADVEVLNLTNLTINPCAGCFACWFRTPGKCILKDDIHFIREKLMKAQVFIFATPVYMFSSSGHIKLLMERLFFPLAMPDFILKEEKLYHPARYPDRKWKSMMITIGAFDGEDVVSPVNNMYKRSIESALDENGGSVIEDLGIINIGFSMLLSDRSVIQRCKSVFDSMNHLGIELVQKQKASKELLKNLGKPIYEHIGISREQAVEKNNDLIKNARNKFMLSLLAAKKA